ncbi:MAG: nicotinate (nicotinamide) nucleotide adenylyltransferase [Armatimonadetes bacterium]|nr:nicotinate (nicotinamide) nucleotide adenylyltransferase [Armatimonadota bacterium]
MRYGVLGGSFDPPHLGHLALAEAAVEALHLDEVIFVPASRNPLKPRGEATSDERLEMTRLMVEDKPLMSVSDVEVSRGGPSYMVDTLTELSVVLPGHAWLLIGADALAHFTEWRKPERIVKIVRLAVVGRGIDEAKTAIARLPEYMRESCDPVPMKPNTISSTKIRETIERGFSAEMWLDPKVWDYVCERGLYKS